MALTALTGVANALVGSLLIALPLTGTLPEESDHSGPMVLAVAWTYLVLGGVTVCAAVGLSGRRHNSRVVLTVVMLVEMAVACVSFGLVGTWCTAASLVAVAVSWVVIALLWDSRANEFYLHAARWQDTP